MLFIGHCCLDNLSEVHKYPEEDEDVRCISQRWQRGGNASNNASVLGILGAQPTLLCTLADSREKDVMLSDLKKYGIVTDRIVLHAGRQCPSSVVICSLTTGSRTIVHSNQDLPEITPQDLEKIDLDQYSWVHFEGRNVKAVIEMQEMVVRKAPQVTVSVELEKARADLEELSKNAHIIFASKDYARHLGFKDMEAAVEGIFKRASQRCNTVIVPWGEEGACGRTRSDSQMFTSPAFPPSGGVVDSLGAGDTFIAATIYALARKNSLQQSLTFGCHVAGLKVGLKGWEELRLQLPLQNWVKDV